MFIDRKKIERRSKTLKEKQKGNWENQQKYHSDGEGGNN